MSFLDDARTRELWEKVKAELSGKQPKLAGTPGQAVGFGADGGAVAVRGWSNPNLLENWYFADPVNHRGASGTITTAGYFIDLWKLVSGSVTIGANGLVLNGTITQVLETAPESSMTASVLTSAGVASASYSPSKKHFPSQAPEKPSLPPNWNSAPTRPSPTRTPPETGCSTISSTRWRRPGNAKDTRKYLTGELVTLRLFMGSQLQPQRQIYSFRLASRFESLQRYWIHAERTGQLHLMVIPSSQKLFRLGSYRTL